MAMAIGMEEDVMSNGGNCPIESTELSSPPTPVRIKFVCNGKDGNLKKEDELNESTTLVTSDSEIDNANEGQNRSETSSEVGNTEQHTVTDNKMENSYDEVEEEYRKVERELIQLKRVRESLDGNDPSIRSTSPKKETKNILPENQNQEDEVKENRDTHSSPPEETTHPESPHEPDTPHQPDTFHQETPQQPDTSHQETPQQPDTSHQETPHQESENQENETQANGVNKEEEGTQKVTEPPTAKVISKVVEAALEAGRKFNSIVMEKTEEMVKVSEDLLLEVKSFRESRTSNEVDKKVSKESVGSSFDFAAGMMPKGKSSGKEGKTNAIKNQHLDSATSIAFENVEKVLASLQQIIQQLQSASVQAEVNMIKQVKIPTEAIERKQPTTQRGGPHDKGIPSAMPHPSSSEYTVAQHNKMREWYKLFPRPLQNEIEAMQKILNMHPYADMQKPNGIASKQVRLWFDKRRSLERVKYIRNAANDAKGRGLHAKVVEKIKAKATSEAKEKLEERISKLKKTLDPSKSVLVEAEKIRTGELVPVADYDIHPSDESEMDSDDEDLPLAQSRRPSQSESAKKRSSKSDTSSSSNKRLKTSESKSKSTSSQDKRKKVIEKDSVLRMKRKLEKLLSSKQPTKKKEVEEIVKTIDSWNISKSILLQSKIIRQIQKTVKIYRKEKDLYSLAKRVYKSLNDIINSDEKQFTVKETTTTTRTPIKFTTLQVRKLEEIFLENYKPEASQLKEILDMLNTSPLADTKTQPDGITMTQLRRWFNKRRCNGRPPLSISTLDVTSEGKKQNKKKEIPSEEKNLTETDDDSEDNKPILPASSKKSSIHPLGSPSSHSTSASKKKQKQKQQQQQQQQQKPDTSDIEEVTKLSSSDSGNSMTSDSE